MADDIEKHSYEAFPEAFKGLMREKFGDASGKFDLRPVLSRVEGYSYEGLRLMLRGKRTLKMEAIEGMAQALGVSPHYFLEYRVMWAAAKAKEHPELGEMLYEVARRFVEPAEGKSSGSK
ncbi:MAG: hypothetical protein JW990_14055 [Thermoleophilia bacterium]|nr:hypothetical protein [Thermoleophilia bacterium]